jgi:hypothetical protein
VRVLPCVISFVDGVSVDRILGFEGLGNGDWFTTRDLESRLLRTGVLVRAKVHDDEEADEEPVYKSIRSGNMKRGAADDENDDWD